MLVHRSRLDAYTVYLIYSGLISLSGSTIFVVNMVYMVEVAHLNPLQLVLVGTTLETVAFIAQIPTGVLADIYSRRLSVISGIFVFGLAFMLEGSFPRFIVILAAQVLFGVGASLMDGAEQAWIAGEVGDERVGQVFLRGTQVSLLADLLGAGVGVVLGSIRLNLPIITGGAFAVVIAGFLLLFMPETNFHPAEGEERHSWRELGDTFRAGLRAIRGRPVLMTILLIALFYGLYSEGFDRLWTAHILADFTLPVLWQLKPVVWFGIISVAGTLLTLAASEVVRRRVDSNNQRLVIRALLIINVFGVVGLLIFALAGNFYLALAALLTFNVFRAVNEPVYTAWLTQNIDAKVRATVISMRGQIDALGQIAGGPPVGSIGTVFSIRAALVASSIILSPVVLLFAYASRKKKSQVE
ncbi:MAG TPA: MFS transporter [Ktedonobacteraceae bacterium]|nr:MFS transporter [Ktedonobacteraceae bacterium]